MSPTGADMGRGASASPSISRTGTSSSPGRTRESVEGGEVRAEPDEPTEGQEVGKEDEGQLSD
eukprot:9651003-Heterocapsa_arctica.AAC.1